MRLHVGSPTDHPFDFGFWAMQKWLNSEVWNAAILDPVLDHVLFVPACNPVCGFCDLPEHKWIVDLRRCEDNSFTLRFVADGAERIGSLRIPRPIRGLFGLPCDGLSRIGFLHHRDENDRIPVQFKRHFQRRWEYHYHWIRLLVHRPIRGRSVVDMHSRWRFWVQFVWWHVVF